MRVFANLLFKVTLSSMILTAPAMINGNYTGSILPGKNIISSSSSAAVIRKFVDHPTMMAIRAVAALAATAAPAAPAPGAMTAPPVALAVPVPVPVPAAAPASVSSVSEATAVTASARAAAADAKVRELRMVINQATFIYANMNLEAQGLNEKAFEYAWRGYHNLLKKGMIEKRAVLSICDFSQSSNSKRMYVIDVQHQKVLYRTYVAHGQNSGAEYASEFSNDIDSYKSSLGFYVTQRTYMGRNGLSLRLNGVDVGYNDMAFKRQIVLHGSPYVCDKYMQAYGTLGTSLGCPAIPASVSGKIIRAVKNGSCLFIYHPTPQYLGNSTIING